MKKIFLTTLIAAMIGSQVFASDVSKVSYRVLAAFEAQFADASDVSWTVTETIPRQNSPLKESR